MKIIDKIVVCVCLIISNSCNENHECKTYYPNKTVKEIYFENSSHQYNGLYKSFYLNGKIKLMGVSLKNTTIGTWYSYYSNGRINTQILYDNHGHVLSANGWNKKGVLTLKDGTGVGEMYYDNEQIMTKSNYKNNKLHGKTETWHENGKRNTITCYQNGEACGTWYIWDQNGTLIRTENH